MKIEKNVGNNREKKRNIIRLRIINDNVRIKKEKEESYVNTTE